jgi:hypothetical protein
MPDPQRKTISASQAAALWNSSPYATRWMLWHQFANGVVMDQPETSRMRWGKLLEPVILAEVAKAWKFEVFPNQEYVRRGLLGATRDASIMAPGRGPGAVEVKCVFSYDVWMQDWQGGKTPPRQHEIQLQCQMKVGDGDGTKPYQWGLLVAWVASDMYFFERAPITALWAQLDIEAARFFASVEKREEPEAFGAEVEIPWLTSLFPTVKDQVLDLSADHEHVKTAEDLRIYGTHKNLVGGYKRVTEEFRAKFLALAKEANFVRLPCGFSYRVQKSGNGKTIVPIIPEVPLDPPPVPESVLMGG